jgi:hypothetical protein
MENCFMLKTLLRACALVAGLLLPFAAIAAEDDASVAANLPTAVADVASGGNWSQDKQGGFYRALVIMAPERDGFAAHLYLQWLSLPADNSLPSVAKTVPVKEVNDQKLPFASLEMTGEDNKDNEITVIVSSFNAEQNKDIELYVKAGAPGTYGMEKAPPKPAAGGQ